MPTFLGSATQSNEISAQELKRWMDEGRDVQLIDVREPHEFAIAHIPRAILIPLGALVARRDEIDLSREVVVLCKSGARSAKAIMALEQSGFPGRLTKLTGGILAWSRDVDPSVPKY